MPARAHGWGRRGVFIAVALACVLSAGDFSSAQLLQPMAPSAPPPLLAPPSGQFDNKLLCMADMVSNVEDSCSNGPGTAYYTELEDVLKRYLTQCFNASFSGRALHLMFPDLSPAAASWLKDRADSFKAVSGIEVVTTFVPATQINDEIEFELGNNLTYMHDGWILDPMAIGDIYNLNGFLDLRPMVQADTSLNWSDVVPFFDTKAGMFNHSLVVMPMDGHVELLYYRKDLFLQYGYPVPRTWDEALAIALDFNQTQAANVNASAANATQVYGFCLERRKACGVGAFQLLTMAAPYLQYRGSSQGLVFDPTKIYLGAAAALVDNPAMQRALEVYSLLSALSPPSLVNDTCSTPLLADHFSAGRCLMTIGLSDVFKATNSSKVVRDVVGVAQTPGALAVLDRDAAALIACNSTALCPYAETITLTDGSTQLLNRAPFAAGGGWAAAVNAQMNSRTNTIMQQYTYNFFSYLNSPLSSFQSLTTPQLTDFSPYRYQHLTNISAWIAAGFSAVDVEAFLGASLAALQHPNIALDLRVEPGIGSTRLPTSTQSFRSIYDNAVANLTTSVGWTPASTMAQMHRDMATYLNNPQVTNLPVLTSSYRYSIQYVEPAAPPAPPSQSHFNWLPIAIVLPVVCTLLILAAGAAYTIRNMRKHKNLLGKVLPPSIGADTTVIITDIQDYATLLQALPPDVMEAVMQGYGEALRKLLPRHSGYESAMEGDSFIFVFHSPKDALLFAMEAQEALLQVEWPAQLLELSVCPNMYAQGISKEQRPKHLQDILDVNDQMLTTAESGKLVSLGLSSLDSVTLGMADLPQAANCPSIPALANVPLSEVCSFAVACQKSWKEVASLEEPNSSLIFRGLRVRMGVHAGFHNAADVTKSRTDARQQYGGPTIALARSVLQVSQGGSVLISEETYKKLPLERLWVKYLVLHVGEHQLSKELPHLNLYLALNRSLEARLAFLAPQQSLHQMDPGVLEAPVGCVTVAFMNVVGAQTLLSWNADVAQHALKMFQVVVGEELKKRNGYLVEAVDGLFLAAFHSPVEAIRWALKCNEDMLKQDWSESLLSHELCEELTIAQPHKGTGEIVHMTVFRGLRLKTGVDTGQVLGEVHAMTGRMTYRGKVMNRAARIAGTASTGQVLASVDSWMLALSKDKEVLVANQIISSSLGHFLLKGVAERIEIFHCRKAAYRSSSSPMDPEDGPRSMDLTYGDGSSIEQWSWDQQMAQAIGPDDIVLGPNVEALDLNRRCQLFSNSARNLAALINDSDDCNLSGSDVEGHSGAASEDENDACAASAPNVSVCIGPDRHQYGM